MQEYQENAMASLSSLKEGGGGGERQNNNKLETFQKGFCGLDAKPNYNQYVIEYVLPQACEMALGISPYDYYQSLHK